MASYCRLSQNVKRFRNAVCNLRYLSEGPPPGCRPTFDKVLVANRGEIACRVMKTCREMGIKTVAIYSDADAQALHVRMADEAVRVGPAVATESYLNMDAVLSAIRTTGAKAVHPGYGFFSENKHFANELDNMGVVFIGPNTHAIHVMGDKLESKRTATEAGVNIIPGFDGIVKDADEAVALANDIGYPVMLKASAGGGGKGMRIAWNDDETRQGFVLATEEAKSAVKDDRLLIERFVDKSRHIEIQVLGDSHGNAVYLNERECSIQRRNQKVIEEAPSTFLLPETRRAMGEQAVALAKAVKYNSAGTCEFLVDSQRNFYFLEMNTRLQVEHPITEMITGVDLVKEMIHSAAKYPLQLKQSDIGIKGWAVEARVYAEDPVRFLPSIGYLSTYREPTDVKGTVRVDTGIVEGSSISMYYDPMISKLVTHGNTREEALETMGQALDSYCIQGVKHNIPILRDIIGQPTFVSGDITTNFMPEVYPSGFKGRTLSEDEKYELLACAVVMHLKREALSKSFVNQSSYERMYMDQDSESLCVAHGDHKYEARVTWSVESELNIQFGDLNFIGGGNYVSTINSPRELSVEGDWCLGEPVVNLQIDGHKVTVQYEGRKGQKLDLRLYGCQYSVTVSDMMSAALEDEHIPKSSLSSELNQVAAPMPGVVKSLSFAAGDLVEEGSVLVTLEAMKMLNPLSAPRTGKVKEVLVKVGDSVAEDDVLLTFEP